MNDEIISPITDYRNPHYLIIMNEITIISRKMHLSKIREFPLISEKCSVRNLFLS